MCQISQIITQISLPKRLFALSAVVVLLLLIVGLSLYFVLRSNNDTEWTQAETILVAEIDSLKSKFPLQSGETWSKITDTFIKTLKPNAPKRAAVIAVFVPMDQDAEFASCLFLSYLCVAVHKARVPLLKTRIEAQPTVSNQTLQDHSAQEIPNKSGTIFKWNHRACIGVDIREITYPEDKAIFHAYLEKYGLVDPRSVILLMFHVSKHIYDGQWDYSKGASIFNAVLSRISKNDIARNVTGDLMSKVADTIILLSNGDKCEDLENDDDNDDYLVIK